jgi:hypothetical protein
MSLPRSFFVLLVVTLIVVTSFGAWSAYHITPSTESPADTVPIQVGRVTIGAQEYTFNPADVQTLRPDVFQSHYFSLFDVVVHVARQEAIPLEYHFDATLNTHILDQLQGDRYWWYYAYYSGGWVETNVFRPDHYPWKDGTTLTYYTLRDGALLDQIYAVWRSEGARQALNPGPLIIPHVMIRGHSFTMEFTDVVVTPHHLRNDTFRENMTTAIDVILSLGDQGQLTYTLQWFESIGSASIVKNYWVAAINEDEMVGRCGFVYEAGSPTFRRFRGNHIHIPADSRILNWPEYVEFFWVCV